MVTTEFADHTAHESAGERFTRIAGGVVLRIAGAWRAWQNRRSVAKLLTWDARMLGDIGLTAGDVHAAMSTPRLEDPSARLGALSAERRVGRRAAGHDELALIAGSRARSPRRKFTVIET